MGLWVQAVVAPVGQRGGITSRLVWAPGEGLAEAPTGPSAWSVHCPPPFLQLGKLNRQI